MHKPAFVGFGKAFSLPPVRGSLPDSNISIALKNGRAPLGGVLGGAVH